MLRLRVPLVMMAPTDRAYMIADVVASRGRLTASSSFWWTGTAVCTWGTEVRPRGRLQILRPGLPLRLDAVVKVSAITMAIAHNPSWTNAIVVANFSGHNLTTLDRVWRWRFTSHLPTQKSKGNQRCFIARYVQAWRDEIDDSHCNIIQ